MAKNKDNAEQEAQDFLQQQIAGIQSMAMAPDIQYVDDVENYSAAQAASDERQKEMLERSEAMGSRRSYKSSGGLYKRQHDFDANRDPYGGVNNGGE